MKIPIAPFAASEGSAKDRAAFLFTRKAVMLMMTPQRACAVRVPRVSDLIASTLIQMDEYWKVKNQEHAMFVACRAI